MAQRQNESTDDYERRITEWLRLGMMLLAQTVVVALFLGKLYVDVEYLKQGLGESRIDRAAIREQIKALGVLEYRLNECQQKIDSLHTELSNHAAGDSKR